MRIWTGLELSEVTENERRILTIHNKFCTSLGHDKVAEASLPEPPKPEKIKVAQKRLWGVALDGQNRQSPIASDFGSRTQIAALFAILLYPNV